MKDTTATRIRYATVGVLVTPAMIGWVLLLIEAVGEKALLVGAVSAVSVYLGCLGWTWPTIGDD